MARANKTLNIAADGVVPETLKDAPRTAPAPPSAPEVQSAVDFIVGQIKAIIARAIERLPPELRGNAFVIESVLNQELDKANVGGWRALILVEGVAAIQNLKSDVKHDPTELA